MRTSKTVGGVKHNYYYVQGKLMYEDCPSYKLFYTYDANGFLSGIKRILANGATENYGVHCNIFGDVISIYYEDGMLAATYTYDSWGKLLSVTETFGADVMGDNDIWTQNSIRYRGYVYDEETQLYYLQSRYYDPNTCRFINADDYSVLTASPTALTDKNLFAYCDCNPVVRKDTQGEFWDTVFDVISLAVSISDVVKNPNDPLAWVGLAADAISLVVPFATGGGTAVKAISKVDDFVDISKTTRVINKTSNTTQTVVTGATKSKKVAGVITGYTKHGLSQAIGRNDGLGVSPSAILDAVRNPQKIVNKIDNLGRHSTQYRGKNSTVVLNGFGQIISCWAKSSKYWRGK